MAVKLINQTEVPDAPTPKPVAKAIDYTPVLKAIALGISVLNARLLLLLALLAASYLGYLAVLTPEPTRLIAAGIFNAVVFLPLVCLYVHKGGNS